MKQLEYLSRDEALLLLKEDGMWSDTAKAVIAREKKYKIGLIVLGCLVGACTVVIAGGLYIAKVRRDVRGYEARAVRLFCRYSLFTLH